MILCGFNSWFKILLQLIPWPQVSYPMGSQPPLEKSIYSETAMLQEVQAAKGKVQMETEMFG